MNIALLLRTTLYFDWLRLKRGPQFKGKLAVRIIAALVAVYLFLNLILLGYFIDVLLSQKLLNTNMVAVINRQIIYLFVLLVVIRFFYEKPPHVDFRFFLCLPVARSRLVLIYLLRLLGGKLNLIPLFIALPFWIKNILPAYDAIGSMCWLVGFFMVNFAFTLLGLLLRFLFFELKAGAILLFGVMALAIGLDVAKGTAILRNFSTFVFDSLLHAAPVVSAACIILFLPLAVITYKVLQKALYLDFGR